MMSCESRHRAIIRNLLTLAGLHDTVPVDEVMGVGVAYRYRWRARPTIGAASAHLHADARNAVGITGHSDQAIPSWVSSLVDHLHTAAERGNRYAFLTEQFLTGGTKAVTPRLTWSDRGWLLTAKRVGIQVPQAWDGWLTATRSAAIVGRLLFYPARNAVVLSDVLDALVGIDDVPPDAAQVITPQQVLRMVHHQPFGSRSELQQVLRAILDDAPVVRETVNRVIDLYGVRPTPGFNLPYALLGSAARARERSVEQAGNDAVLTLLAGWIQAAGGPPVDPTALHGPTPEVVQTMITFLRGKRYDPFDLAAPIITALMSIWQTSERNDAVEQAVQNLAQILAVPRIGPFLFSAIIAPVIAGVIRPPHGDTIIAGLSTAADEDAWSALAAGAMYAAACAQIGHVPTVNGIENLIRDRWGDYRDTGNPSPIPLLAVGRERELLLPALHAARGTAAWLQMLLDVTDAMDMLDMVGGDPQTLLAVLADALSGDGGTVAPWIVVRLAASRCGQDILARLPTGDTLSAWTHGNSFWAADRVIPHLVSPWWATAPPHLRDWWERVIRQVAQSEVARLLDDPPPLYPTVMLQAAVNRPTDDLVRRAVATPQWATLPEADRRACLDAVFRGVDSPWYALDIASRAASSTVLQDIAAAVVEVCNLSDTNKRLIRLLIEPDAWRSG